MYFSFYVLLSSDCSSATNGRPRMSVDIDEIEFLRSLRFTYKEIANILGISRATLYRRLDEEGLSDCTYTTISDQDLDSHLIAIKCSHPNDGERLLAGHLCCLGIIVPRSRLRGSIHRVDPENTATRRSVTVRRRVYHVEGPNCVWHIDGNHKLIRWRFVIHGAIDGYSRLITMLKCSDNNKASTVLKEFTTAVNFYGLPNQIRTDLGGENVDIWRYMIEQHSNRAAVITGASTHNERIERLWRDVYRCVAVIFHEVFYNLEEKGCLNTLNEVDLFCLHYVFLPRINQTLQEFSECWNNHAVSSEHNLTPNQMFIRGAIQQNMTPSVPQMLHSSGNSRSDIQATTDEVEVPKLLFKPCDQLLALLNSQINPLQPTNGITCNLYDLTVQVIGNHLALNCPNCN